MHTVELLDAAIRCAEDLGFRIRDDWLEGADGGACEIGGERWLFLDLAQSPQERLAIVASCLAEYALQADAAVPDEVRDVLPKRTAA